MCARNFSAKFDGITRDGYAADSRTAIENHPRRFESGGNYARGRILRTILRNGAEPISMRPLPRRAPRSREGTFADTRSLKLNLQARKSEEKGRARGVGEMEMEDTAAREQNFSTSLSSYLRRQKRSYGGGWAMHRSEIDGARQEAARESADGRGRDRGKESARYIHSLSPPPFGCK